MADRMKTTPVPLEIKKYENKEEFLTNYMKVLCKSIRGRLVDQGTRMYCVVDAPYSKVAETIHPKATILALEFVNMLEKEDRPVEVEAIYDQERAQYIFTMFF